MIGAKIIRHINNMLNHRFPARVCSTFGRSEYMRAFASGKDHHTHFRVQHTRPDFNLSGSFTVSP
jgi:hypothetical protein